VSKKLFASLLMPKSSMCRDLAGNTFTGGIPYSISQMTDLEYL